MLSFACHEFWTKMLHLSLVFAPFQWLQATESLPHERRELWFLLALDWFKYVDVLISGFSLAGYFGVTWQTDQWDAATLWLRGKSPAACEHLLRLRPLFLFLYGSQRQPCQSLLQPWGSPATKSRYGAATENDYNPNRLWVIEAKKQLSVPCWGWSF